MSMISSEMELIIAFYLCLFRFHFIGVFRSCEKSHLLIVTLINSINYLTCCWYNRTRIFNNFAIFKFHLTLYSSFNLFGCCQFCLAFGYYFFCEFTKITNLLISSTIESFFDHTWWEISKNIKLNFLKAFISIMCEWSKLWWKCIMGCFKKLTFFSSWFNLML